MTYRATVINRECSVLVYGEHPVNYLASCQVFINGDVGYIHTVNGDEFYAAMPNLLASLMEQIGITSLEAYVMPAHARLMRRAFKSIATVEDIGRGMMAGHEMVKVRVRCLD